MVKFNPEDLVSHEGIAVVIKNNNGELLVQEHVKYGFWTIPVGKAKDGQKAVDALKQEILEECNLTVDDYREIITRDYAYSRDGHQVTVRAHLFEVLRYSGTLNNNEPHKHRQQLFMELKKVKNLSYLSDLTLLYLETQGFKRKNYWSNLRD